MILLIISMVILRLAICSASNNENCTCVPYYQCSEETGYLIVDGKGLLDMRGFDKSQCKGYFDVCCNLTTLAKPKSIPLKLEGCGYQNYGFSWLAALLQQDQLLQAPKYKCGGSLIHQQVVVTAAHCLQSEGTWIIRIGEKLYEADRTIPHPQFNLGTLQNDIALIILKSPVQVNFETICIPPPGVVIDKTRCLVIVPREEYPMNMKFIELPMVSRNRCEEKLRATRLGQFFQLHESFLCAGGETFEDVCGGDGGSPLVCPVPAQPGRYHQVGIVSWGIGCGLNDTPGVYVRMSHFREWIDEVLLTNGFNVTNYRY